MRRLGLAGLAVALGWAQPAWACMTVITDTGAAYVSRERALIAWDPATQTEHFVRKVDFSTKAGDVGFIVPMPNVPEVAEADEEVFKRLNWVTHPPPLEKGVLWAPGLDWPFLGWGSLAPRKFRYGTGIHSLANESTEATGARVEGSFHLTGFEVTVLGADSTQALSDWLGAHAYVKPEGFESWAGHYVAQRWHFVAFRMTSKPGGEGRGLSTKAVRISVKTEAPFYPYLEPPSRHALPRQPDQARLELFVVSPEPLEGRVAGAAWTAEREVAARLPLGEALRGAVPHPETWASAWVDQYQDRAFDRPMDDLFFRPAPGTATRLPPPPKQYSQHVLLVRWPAVALLLAPLGGLLWRRRRAA